MILYRYVFVKQSTQKLSEILKVKSLLDPKDKDLREKCNSKLKIDKRCRYHHTFAFRFLIFKFLLYTYHMKSIVTHMSPDLDAITSVWVIKRFLPGWDTATVEFVPAGQRSERVKNYPEFNTSTVLSVNGDEIMHVDTGMGPLDHHQTPDMNVCGASRSWEYVKSQLAERNQPLKEEHVEAVDRMVKVVVSYDHFQEVYWADASADYHDFGLFGINEGLQYSKQGEDAYYIEFGGTCLDYLLHYFENKVWAEKELAEGTVFETRYGKALGIESINESVVKQAQKKGFVLVVRKDKRRGHVSIKTLPRFNGILPIHSNTTNETVEKNEGIDLTLAYEQFRKMDPDATWFLHVSKKMLLNGSVKNPDMVPTKLTLEQLIKVLEKMYE